MPLMTEIARRVRQLLRGSGAASDLDDEMRLHLELRVEWFRNRGLSPRDAQVAAQRRFGSVQRWREESMDAWGWRWLEQLLQDVRFGLRTLRKEPAFAATVVVTLALATGATTAIFSIVDGVLLRPLPFAEPDRLVQVYGRSWREDRGNTPDPLSGPVVPAELEAFTAQSTLFEGFVGYALGTRHVRGATGVERVMTVQADSGLFTVLGADALVGRTFRPDDSLDVVVISAAFWRRHFDEDPSVQGRAITLDGGVFTILGVMPDVFQFPYRAASGLAGALPESRTDLWIPLEPFRAAASPPERRGRVNVIARLGRGVTLDAANAELRVIAQRYEAERYAGTNYRAEARLVPLADVVIGEVRASLWMLFAAVGLVLVAACANVANLLLARMAARTREVVTRAALGAGQLRLMRQFFAESLVISLAGGLFGAVFAQWGTRVLVSLGSAKIPRAHEVALDWRTYAFLVAACLATAVVFGLAPALTAARADVQGITKESGGRTTASRGLGRLRDSLVIVQIALAFVLTLAAASVIQEVIRLQNVDTGMVPENAVALHVTPRATAAEYHAIEARVRAVPGVEAAGFIQLLPLQNWGWIGSFSIAGRPTDERPVTELRYVTPGYFSALGVRIVRGRPLTEADTLEAPRVILINEALADRYFPGEDPIGRELDRGLIVGVVRDVRQTTLDRPAHPEVYYAVAQNVAMTSDLGMSLIVRTAGEPEAMVASVRAAVRDVAPSLAIFNVKSMRDVLRDSLWELNLYRWLIGMFAGLALVLVSIGLYGVIAYNVSSRLREFAVRLALGSHPAALARLVLGRGIGLAAAGLVVGVITALAIRLVLQDLPISFGGPGSFAGIAVVVLVVTLTACLRPALRVAATNPVAALRHD